MTAQLKSGGLRHARIVVLAADNDSTPTILVIFINNNFIAQMR
jgi:hypothetical protein